MIAAHHHKPFIGDPTPSGVPDMDALLAGGPLRGTSTLVSGPAGSGKTTLTLQYVHAACERRIRKEVDERNGRMVVIDSFNGYVAAMPQEQYVVLPDSQGAVHHQEPRRPS